MKYNFLQKTRTLFFLIAMTLCLKTPQNVQAAEAELKTTIEQQIRAYADSIDTNNAANSAANSLAKHGLTGRGKKLEVGSNHALTTTLLNSEYLQTFLTESLSEAIKTMQQSDQEDLYLVGAVVWRENDGYYVMRSRNTPGQLTEGIECQLYYEPNYQGDRNAYDDALEWMVSVVKLNAKIERVKTTEKEAVYSITCTIKDRFDFATSNKSEFKNLMSSVGGILFEEYDWEATFELELTAPYTCAHTSGNYHWYYNCDKNSMVCDTDEECSNNEAVKHMYVKSDGTTISYYELSETIRLYHDKPWVIEYDVKNAKKFSLTPFENTMSNTKPTLLCRNGTSLYFVNRDYRSSSTGTMVADGYYGTDNSNLFKYISTITYRYCLENEIHSDGTNMVYLTITNLKTGEILGNKIPMDDFYSLEKGAWEFQSDSENWMCEKDWYINYIGNRIYGFDTDYFQLWIWENGKNAQTESFLSSKVVNSTCTENGYTLHTCKACGYSYKDTYIKATGHFLNDWSVVKAATCTENGLKERNCSSCSYTETETIAMLSHDYRETVTLPTCEKEGYTAHVCEMCGQSYLDSFVEATEHPYGEWQILIPVTCETDGLRRRNCTECTHFEQEVIETTGHLYVSDVTKPTCEHYGITNHKCSRCGDEYVDGYKKPVEHQYKKVITKATLHKEGKIETKCSSCNKVSETVKISKIKTVKLNYTKYTYNGKVKTPAVVIKDSKGKILNEDKDYTVIYSNGRKNTGQYTVTIKFKGNYSGEKKLTFKILPAASDKVTGTSTAKSIKVSWKKASGASGYRVQLLSSSGKVLKTKYITSLSYTFNNLKTGTNYKIKITSYKKIDGVKEYSLYSKSIKIKTK